MKYFIASAIMVCLLSFGILSSKDSIHQFKVKALDESVLNFAKYKGKKILVVNVASKCGFTPQYAALEKVYEQYKDKLVIVGFPCNQFHGQEPGSSAEIQEFCTKTYGVTFPMAAKVDVKGDSIAPIYKWLCNKSENGVLDATITWNFNKFILDENGKMLAYFPSTTKPDSDDILKYLK
jgi:glutathione peroxidase